jgi:hypothetical protein
LVRAAEVLCLLINSALECGESEQECRSSEEMQRAVQDANAKIQDEGIEDIMVWSMDVVGLFPNLALEDMLLTVFELFLSTRMEMQEVDDQVLAQYLAVMVTKQERRSWGCPPASRGGQWRRRGGPSGGSQVWPTWTRTNT